ncbi:hypothetical protein D3C78_1418360 [compost metagenome]
MLAVNRARCKEQMDTRVRRPLERLANRINILLARAGQADNRSILNCACNCIYSCKVAWRSCREAGFNPIHSQLLKLQGNFYLFLRVQIHTGRLLSITKCCVEYINFPHICHAPP